MYAVRVKPTAEPSDLHEFRPSSAAISEFDDDEEIVPDRKRKQQRARDEDTEMDEADPTAFTEELRTVDASSQLFLSSKRTRREQLQITGGLYVGGGVFARPEQNSVRISDLETENDRSLRWLREDRRGSRQSRNAHARKLTSLSQM
jgi:hypothetical protein